MQKIKLKTEESGKKLLEAYAPPKWSETADDDDESRLVTLVQPMNFDTVWQNVLSDATIYNYDVS